MATHLWRPVEQRVEMSEFILYRKYLSLGSDYDANKSPKVVLRTNGRG